MSKAQTSYLSFYYSQPTEFYFREQAKTKRKIVKEKIKIPRKARGKGFGVVTEKRVLKERAKQLREQYIDHYTFMYLFTCKVSAVIKVHYVSVVDGKHLDIGEAEDFHNWNYPFHQVMEIERVRRTTVFEKY